MSSPTGPVPYYTDESVTLHHGDALDVLRQLPDNSVHAVVTDPPAGISFMGKEWDGAKGGREQWSAWLAAIMAEALRVTKPGGHALVWALPRTAHWTACALEDAGWEIRDRITHLFGSGFPKSLDVSKAIDRAAGAEREVIGPKRRPDGSTVLSARGGHESRGEGWDRPWRDDPEAVALNGMETAPATDAARRWQGWGTALKPGAEDWWVARKPLAGTGDGLPRTVPGGPLTVAANVLEHGTGAINVDGCRVGNGGHLKWEKPRDMGYHGGTDAGPVAATENPAGRWPTNVVLDNAAAAELDRQTGILTSGELKPYTAKAGDRVYGHGLDNNDRAKEYTSPADSGGASRFFPTFRYEAKAPTHERPRVDGEAHSTVKPLDLMRWLVRLVTPPGGTVLDPFAGSGTTAEACVIEGARCITIEREAAYLPLIVARLSKPIQPDLFGIDVG